MFAEGLLHNDWLAFTDQLFFSKVWSLKSGSTVFKKRTESLNGISQWKSLQEIPYILAYKARSHIGRPPKIVWKIGPEVHLPHIRRRPTFGIMLVKFIQGVFQPFCKVIDRDTQPVYGVIIEACPLELIWLMSANNSHCIVSWCVVHTYRQSTNINARPSYSIHLP